MPIRRVSRPLRLLLADLWRFSPARFALTFVLSLASSLAGSLSLLLLVPLVVSTGALGDEGSSIATATGSVLSRVSIPLTLGWMLVVYVVVVTAKATLTAANNLVSARLRLEFVDGLRVRLFEAAARAEWRFHLDSRTSDVSHALIADIPRIDRGVFLLFAGMAQLITALAFLALAIQLSPSSLAIAIGLIVMLLASLWRTAALARRLGKAETTFGKQSFSTQSEFLNALKLIKSHGREAHHVMRYRSDIDDVRRTAFGFELVGARSLAVVEVGTAVALAIMTWVAIQLVEMPAAELVALIVVVARLAGLASALLHRVQGVAQMLPAYEAAQEIVRAASAAAETVAVDKPDPAPVADTLLALSGVSYSYVPGRPVVRDVSFAIRPGEVVALVGPSGGGKSTIADIATGLLEPDCGEVTVEGHSLQSLGAHRWRRRLAYVPQETFLFHDTLRANIEWGSPTPLSDHDIERAIAAAALTDVVAGLPDGLDTMLGDRGHRLSGGERQRVALARALVLDPDLLVLDEATSALDGENEQLVQEAVERLSGTVSILVIAHRLTTIQSADKILVIDKGHIVESGTWDELMAHRGSLAGMATIAG